LSTLSDTVTGPAPQARKINNILTSAQPSLLVTYKLACDVTQYGMTSDIAKKTDFLELKDRMRNLPLQDVMKRFVQNIINLARSVSIPQRAHTSSFVDRTDALTMVFMIAYHPVSFFNHIGDEERDLIRKSTEMLRLLEDLSQTVRTLPAGCELCQNFVEVGDKADCFVRFFQVFIEYYDNTRELQKKRYVAIYKKSVTAIYNIELLPEKQDEAACKLRIATRKNELFAKLKRSIGSGATKVVEDIRIAHMKAHCANVRFQAPCRCASGVDGEVSRRRH